MSHIFENMISIGRDDAQDTKDNGVLYRRCLSFDAGASQKFGNREFTTAVDAVCFHDLLFTGFCCMIFVWISGGYRWIPENESYFVFVLCQFLLNFKLAAVLNLGVFLLHYKIRIPTFSCSSMNQPGPGSTKNGWNVTNRGLFVWCSSSFPPGEFISCQRNGNSARRNCGGMGTDSVVAEHKKHLYREFGSYIYIYIYIYLTCLHIDIERHFLSACGGTSIGTTSG